MKIISCLPKDMVDDEGNFLDKDEEALKEFLRGRIDSAFACQDSKSALADFRAIFKDGKYVNDILSKVDEFGEGSMKFAFLRLPAKYANLIHKKRVELGIDDTLQHGVVFGSADLLLKRIDWFLLFRET